MRPDSAERTERCTTVVSGRNGTAIRLLRAIITEKDLPGFAEGASEGPRAIFDFSDPEFGEYTLGKHQMWAERAKGSPKGHPEIPYTLEIACSLLEKAAVCWMTVAGDDQTLKQFEGNSVTLDGDFSAQLVPASAFDKKPGS